MPKRSRKSMALVLMVVYALITISPLASFVFPSWGAVGACAGECSLCGCDVGASAARLCCCWNSKLRQQHEHQEETPDCCKKALSHSTVVLKCGLPCGTARDTALPVPDTSEMLPFCFQEGFAVRQEGALPIILTEHPYDRFPDPPDPPPKLV